MHILIFSHNLYAIPGFSFNIKRLTVLDKQLDRVGKPRKLKAPSSALYMQMIEQQNNKITK